MKGWRVHQYGRPSDALRLDDIAEPELQPGEVLVRTTATVLNYNEVDGCRGRYLTVSPPVPYVLGMEVTGEVVGGDERWIGRRVVATARNAFGAHAELVACPIDMTFDAPDALPGNDAAAFFFPFHLAWLGLHERGRVQPGETVVVLAAAGGVGSAAVQLAVAAGARVIAVAGGATKLDVCRALGAHVLVDHTTEDIVEAVNRATDGRGADIVFDGVGLPDVALASLGRNGRHLVIGFAGGIEAEDEPGILPRTLCFRNLSVLGVMLAYTSDPARARNLVTRDVGQQIHARLVALLDAGTIKPVIGGRVPFAELPAALDAMEDRATTGRVIVEL